MKTAVFIVKCGGVLARVPRMGTRAKKANFGIKTMMTMSEFRASRQMIFLGASLALHLSVVLAWTSLSTLFSVFEKTHPASNWVEVELGSAPKSVKSKTDERIRNEVKRTQLVEKSKEAAKDAFLGEQTQVVKHETATENSVVNEKAARPQPAEKRKAATLQTGPASRILSQLGLSLAPIVAKNILNQVEIGPENGNEMTAPTYASGDQLTHEYVKGLKKSEKTVLNTKEFVFFGYFERIRTRLDLAWSSTLREQLTKYFRRGRRLASDMDYTTSTLVTLSEAGEVVKVQVLAESGTRDLDDAAVKAFNEAGPFPNPPKGIIDNSGNVQIRWDFVLRN